MPADSHKPSKISFPKNSVTVNPAPNSRIYREAVQGLDDKIDPKKNAYLLMGSAACEKRCAYIREQSISAIKNDRIDEVCHRYLQCTKAISRIKDLFILCVNPLMYPMIPAMIGNLGRYRKTKRITRAFLKENHNQLFEDIKYYRPEELFKLKKTLEGEKYNLPTTFIGEKIKKRYGPEALKQTVDGKPARNSSEMEFASNAGRSQVFNDDEITTLNPLTATGLANASESLAVTSTSSMKIRRQNDEAEVTSRKTEQAAPNDKPRNWGPMEINDIRESLCFPPFLQAPTLLKLKQQRGNRADNSR